MNNEELMEKVYEVEGFTVWIDDFRNNLLDYYKREFKSDATVSEWKRRFKKRYLNVSVVIYKGNGDVAHGGTHLRKVRDSYNLENLREEIDNLKLLLRWEQNKNNATDDDDDNNSDPYIILGVNNGCEFTDIQEAYRRMCKSFHTDKLEHLDLHQDFLDFANSKLQQVNVAYQKLRAEHLNLS